MRTLLSLACLSLFLLCACGECGCGDGEGSATPITDGTVVDVTASDADGIPVVAATWRGEGRRLEFSAWEMGCAGCESTIQKRIGALEGVASVEAHKDSAVVQVELEESADRTALTAEITKVLEHPESGKTFRVIRAAP